MDDTTTEIAPTGSEAGHDAVPPNEPKQLMMQGADKKHPQRWTTTEEGDRWLRWTPPLAAPCAAQLSNLVGSPKASQRVQHLAEAEANDEFTVGRRNRLEGDLPFIQSMAGSVKRELDRLRKTQDKTPRLERYAIGRTELAIGEKFSVAQLGDAVNVVFWVGLFLAGCSAEVVVGKFNIGRAELDGMTDGMAWITAFLPFLGTFAALKWLDPGDIDRDRHRYYAWLTRAAVVVTPVSLYLFAAKLDALIEVDFSDPHASLGPSYTWVLWMMQISFAIAVYLASLKISDAWFHFLGYDVRKTREYLDVCDDVATAEDALRSLVELGSRFLGVIAATDARTTKAVEQFQCCYDQCVKDDEKRRRRAKNEVEAAAAQARLDADD